MSQRSSFSSCYVSIISKCTVYPHQKSLLGELKLSVSDLPMLSCHYIQKGLLFPRPPIISIKSLLLSLKTSLSLALSVFPPLASRLNTRSDGSIYISCNDAGVEFIHANAPKLTLHLLLPAATSDDIPPFFMDLFALNGAVSFDGHSLPVASFQITELAEDALFIGCAINHAVIDGTSFWNFFNTWAELCRRMDSNLMTSIVTTPAPDFRRNYFGNSKAVIWFPEGSKPQVSFDVKAPLRERIFHFSHEAILKLKEIANSASIEDAEVCGKAVHDRKACVSSFQSLCGLLWKSVTRARKYLRTESTTTFRMAVNCRHRLVPPVHPFYFGNAIQSIPTTALVAEVAARGHRWSAAQLHESVASYTCESVKRAALDWEGAPRCYPLGNPDGAGITMGSSPRFPMYEGNDFGWGLPLAVRSGRANKFDGKMSAFPGRGGNGGVDIEVCLAPDTMENLLADEEFMQHVAEPCIWKSC